MLNSDFIFSKKRETYLDENGGSPWGAHVPFEKSPMFNRYDGMLENFAKIVNGEIENLFETLNEKEQTILHILRAQEESIHINELALQIKIPYSEIASTLMMLEFKEWVKSLPGGMYRAIR